MWPDCCASKVGVRWPPPDKCFPSSKNLTWIRGDKFMKRLIIGAALLAAAPLCAQAQTPLQPGGFYIGVEGGGNWLLNNTFTSQGYGPLLGGLSGQSSTNWNTGWTAGGSVGYDFVGPRVELEGVYRENNGTLNTPFGTLGAN